MVYHLKTMQALCKVNHCQSTAIQCIVIAFNDITNKSREQRLITKEHIAMHTNVLFCLNFMQYLGFI